MTHARRSTEVFGIPFGISSLCLPSRRAVGSTTPICQLFHVQSSPRDWSMQQRIFVRCAVAFLFFSLIGVALSFVQSVRRAGEMERNLHAVICTRLALQSFVANRRAWPISWEDLANASAHSSGSMYQLPRDLNTVRSRVVLRFDITERDLSNPRKAKLITTYGPSYDYDFGLEPLYRQLEETFPEPNN